MFWVKKATAAGLVSAAVLTLGLGVGLTGNSAGPTAAADPPAKPIDPAKVYPDPKVRELQRQIDELRAKQKRAEEERKQTEQRAREAALNAQIIHVKLGQALMQLEALAPPADASLVLKATGVGGLVLSEIRNEYGNTAWEVTFRQSKPGDLSGLRAYLVRAASDKTVAREVKIVADKEAMTSQVKDLAKACGDAGFTISMVELKPRAPGRDKLADEMTAAEVGLQRERVAFAERMVKKGFMTEAQAQAERARLKLLEAKLNPDTKAGPDGP